MAGKYTIRSKEEKLYEECLDLGHLQSREGASVHRSAPRNFFTEIPSNKYETLF